MKRNTFCIVILSIFIVHVIALIQLDNVVSAPSSTIAKLKQHGKQVFDIQWALSSNVTQMSFNLSTIAFASSNVLSTIEWLPINTTISVSVLQLGSFLSPNGTVLLLTRTDIHPFESVTVVPVNMSAQYSIVVLERAFDTPNCTSVYALISTKFMSSATLVAEISIINGSLLRQFDASSFEIHLGLSDIWDIPSNNNIFVMMNGIGIISLERQSLELRKVYKPMDRIFPIDLVGGAVLSDIDTIIWSNVTRPNNLTELRIWNFVTQENSSSILLTNESYKDLQLQSSFIGIDSNTGNIWTTFMSFGPDPYLATSLIYHYINKSQVIHSEIRLGEWVGWVQVDHSQVGALVINDSLIVVTLNASNSVVIQKFIDV
ncbi:unnamed protein product [Adineta steineri]|uniref:Uncharacterized protein n=1 Tax=Adineta steineri TaxID=433720 RepID=A0A818VGQ8_9BILA|nr:unnamed protein product [Adineta steineri]CAF3712731.1 unnamed protein product [Adineta steineri]